MGLDMYLSKRSYVKRWNHNEKNHTVSVKFDGKKRPDIKPERVTYIEEEVMYWRKANHIHAWFVNNCADGVDNCQPVYVKVEQLEELRKLCINVQEILDKAEKTKVVSVLVGWRNGGEWYEDMNTYEDEVSEKVTALLPPQQGFFFGSTLIDEWYYEQTKRTAEELGKILEEYYLFQKQGKKHGYYTSDFRYESSW